MELESQRGCRAVAAHLPHALHILDRFHIRALQSKAIDEVRRTEVAKLHRHGQSPLLSKTRWALLKNRSNWTRNQRSRMRDLLATNLAAVKTFLYVEAFQHFWTYSSDTWAAKFLRGWCADVMRSKIQPLKQVARTLRSHQPLLLNYFRAKKQITSGAVEGMNNKIRSVLKKSYGFRTDRILQIALYHALGDLPEPALTHEFF
jgi:transposase